MVEALVIGVLTDVELIVLSVSVIALRFVVTVSFPADVPRAVDLSKDAVADVMLGVLPKSSIGVMTDVNTNPVPVVISGLEFSV